MTTQILTGRNGSAARAWTPTALETMLLRLAAATSELIAQRVERRAGRSPSGRADRLADAAEHGRVRTAAYASGLLPGDH